MFKDNVSDPKMSYRDTESEWAIS